MLCSGEFFLGRLKGKVVASFKFVDAALVYVETDYRALTPEFDGKRKAYISQTYD